MAFFQQSNKEKKTSLRAKLGLKNIDSNIENKKQKNKQQGIDNENLDAAFSYVKNELPQYVLEQHEYLEKLVIAFKRPYLMPREKSYKNLIFVFGPEGSGRKYSIQVIAKLLVIRKLVKNSSIYHLDFSNYAEEGTADTLLLPDMYKAFYGDSPIVIIEDFEKGSRKAQEYISTLGIEGVLKVDKRYIWKSGQLQESTGSYAMGSTDNLSANDKYIVFVSSQNPACMERLFPRPFLENVSDILSTQRLDSPALKEITHSFIDECATALSKLAEIKLKYDDSLVVGLAALPCRKGVHDIYSTIRKGIYEPLINQNLNGLLERGKEVFVKLQDGSILCDNTVLYQVSLEENEEEIRKIDEELNKIIGLENVKRFVKDIRELVRFEKKRDPLGKAGGISLHMIFTGNPGTGKTTVARLVAQYLKAIGVLSSGHLVEVSRQDLVAGYVGQTAIKTAQIIRSAVGGVLFIDEAYALSRGKDDTDPFGKEAIDTLVKYIEDYRDDLVVILAGYSDEMVQFLTSNPGLKSRFNHTLEFPDYTAEELYEIAIVTAAGKQYSIDASCKEALEQYFAKQQIPGKNDSGNGRMVRNVIESAITQHSRRLSEEGTGAVANDQLSLLTLDDFGLVPTDDFDLEAELQRIVGLDNVKNLLRSLSQQLYVEKMRRDAGIHVNASQSMNMVFLGNPGTGKTHIARTVARLMKHMEVLKGGQLIETDRGGLVGQYLGHTAQKTRDVFMSALGGVLFIDEAYSLTSENSFDKEAIDTLVKLTEDYAGEIVVILAGYRKEMMQFMNNNLGLYSRFSISMDFPDYTLPELYRILLLQAEAKGFRIDPSAEALIMKEMEAELKKEAFAGNGRMARNLLERAIRKQTDRIARMNNFDDTDVLITLTSADFETERRAPVQGFDLEQKLSSIIGLESVKNHLRSLYATLRITAARKEMGIDTGDIQTLHMVFTGNPGTGKTTIARIVGELLYEMGFLASDTFVETDRSGLVAGHVGQTAIKTKEIIRQALDGVLFIDEAYALASDAHSSGYGKEAIDTLVKDMDDKRDRLVVILAGYSQEMKVFLNTNSGLASRFPNVIHFPDYTADELLMITRKMLEKRKYILAPEAENKLLQVFARARTNPQFGNGRFARNLCDEAIRNLSMRISAQISFTKEDLITICDEDIPE